MADDEDLELGREAVIFTRATTDGECLVFAIPSCALASLLQEPNSHG